MAADHCFKITQLADDTTLFLRDIESLRELFQFLERFGATSGLKINRDKTEIMWMGSEIGNCIKPLGMHLSHSSIKCLGIYCNTDETVAITENYNEKIDKLKKLLGAWYPRNLSLKGKISVLRSLAIPQMLYVTSVLHTPDWVIEKVETLMFDFLWNKKKHHVQKEVVVSEIRDGGLKMPLFGQFVKANRCMWIKRILSQNAAKKALIQSFVKYKDMEIEKVISCMLDPKYIEFKSLFYEQMFSNWYEAYGEVKLQNIMFAPLWHNKNILVNNYPVYHKCWEVQGIDLFGHLLDKMGKICSKAALEAKYNLNIKQMDYNSLIHAIPAEWKRSVIGTTPPEDLKSNGEIYIVNSSHIKILKDMYSKDFYWNFIEKIRKKPKAEEKWNKYIEMENDNWSDYHIAPYIITRDTALQSMQYKIIHRFYPCNYTLSVWYKDKSSKCNYCDQVDYLEHYFYECGSVHSFWCSLQKWWKNSFGVNFALDAKVVLFGLYNPDSDNVLNAINYCILLAKWYIAECRRNSSDLDLYNYLKLAKHKLEIEYVHFTIENDMKKFDKKLKILHDAL